MKRFAKLASRPSAIFDLMMMMMMMMMMMSFLILGTLCLGAESQDLQKVLAFARQINQTVGKTLKKERRMDGMALPETCATACSGMQCAFDDMNSLTERIESAGLSDAAGVMTVAKDATGLVCYHRTAIECAQASSACEATIEGALASTSSFTPAPDCMCVSCPNYPLAIESIAASVTLLSPVMSGSTTPTAEQMQQIYASLCPLTATVQCMATATSCASFMESDTGELLGNFQSMIQSFSCAQINQPTDYSKPYSGWQSACGNEDRGNPDSGNEDSGNEDSGTVALQLNLLAGSCLLSILN